MLVIPPLFYLFLGINFICIKKTDIAEGAEICTEG